MPAPASGARFRGQVRSAGGGYGVVESPQAAEHYAGPIFVDKRSFRVQLVGKCVDFSIHANRRGKPRAHSIRVVGATLQGGEEHSTNLLNSGAPKHGDELPATVVSNGGAALDPEMQNSDGKGVTSSRGVFRDVSSPGPTQGADPISKLAAAERKLGVAKELLRRERAARIEDESARKKEAAHLTGVAEAAVAAAAELRAEVETLRARVAAGVATLQQVMVNSIDLLVAHESVCREQIVKQHLTAAQLVDGPADAAQSAVRAAALPLQAPADPRALAPHSCGHGEKATRGTPTPIDPHECGFPAAGSGCSAPHGAAAVDAQGAPTVKNARRRRGANRRGSKHETLSAASQAPRGGQAQGDNRVAHTGVKNGDMPTAKQAVAASCVDPAEPHPPQCSPRTRPDSAVGVPKGPQPAPKYPQPVPKDMQPTPQGPQPAPKGPQPAPKQLRALEKTERGGRAKLLAEHSVGLAALHRSAAGQRRTVEAAAAAAARRAAEAAALEEAVLRSQAKHVEEEALRQAEEREQAAARKKLEEQMRRRAKVQAVCTRGEDQWRGRITAEEAKERSLLYSSLPSLPSKKEIMDGLVAPPSFMDVKPKRRVTVGTARQLLPPQRPSGRKTIVFDLDETLIKFVRSSDDSEVEPGLWFRQGAVGMLQRLRRKGAEIVVWTAGGSYYAEAVATLLDPSGVVDHIVANHSTWFTDEETYTKNVGCLGRKLGDTLLVENNPQCAAMTPGQTILVPDYEGGADPDSALSELEACLTGWLGTRCASADWLAKNAESLLVDTLVRGKQRVPHLRPGEHSDKRRRAAAA